MTLRELLDAGAHFGHQTRRWNPKMRPYIFGARNGIHIINLETTLGLWNKAAEAITQVVASGKKVLFVGTKAQAQEIVQEEAARAGQFYVNRRWLGGMLTNYQTIKSRIDHWEELEKLQTTDHYQRLKKKETMRLEKRRLKLARSLSGIKEMKNLPGMVILIDPNKEHIAASEARKLRIPLLAITDSNCDPDKVDYVVPANDDAIKSIKLFMSAAADACLNGSKQLEEEIQEESRRRAEETARIAQQKAQEAEEAAERKKAAGAAEPIHETSEPVEQLAAQSE